MASLRVRLIILAVIGVILGIAATYVLMAMRTDFALGFHFDFIDPWIKAVEYFNTNGAYSSIYFKIMIGAVVGMSVMMLSVCFLFGSKAKAKLKAIYSEFDINSRYVVRQRSKETLMIGFGLLACVALILLTFRWLHAGISHDFSGSSGNPFPMFTLILVFSFSIACTYGGLLAMIAIIRYGNYSNLPIVLKDDSIYFFQNFYGFPIIALDRPVEVSLIDAEIDFDSQTSKASLYVSDFEDRIAISPKLEFVNGSFDELADYLEKFAVDDES